MSTGADWLEIEMAGGARICLPRTLDQLTPYVLLEQEDWFEGEIRFVRRWLRPGMRAIDVGANFGVYTLSMAKAIGGEGRVWAFEPTPATAAALERSIERNAFPGVEVMRAAISDRAGKVAFSVGENSELNAIASSMQGGALEVSATTLDREAAERGWSGVDFVKLDVEGHECEAIRGGAEFLSAGSPLVMLEIKAVRNVDMSALEPLAALGYAIYRLLPGPLMLEPFDPLAPFDEYLLNVFACKPERARALEAAGCLSDSGAPHTGPVPRGAWRAFAGSAPYALELAANWRSKAGWFSSPGLGTYFEGLEAFACSRSSAMAPAERVAWLRRSLACLTEAMQQEDTLVRRISHARVAADLGWRAPAIESLQMALERLPGEEEQARELPFLAPSARSEGLAAGGRTQEWLQCALIEQFERLRYFSSVYSGTSSLEVLAPIEHSAFRSAEMDRRLNLVRLRHRLLGAPAASPLLQARSAENLNPEIWSGAEWPEA